LPSVPRLWPGQTICILASGPSLTAEDVARVQGRMPTIVVNTTYQRAPWADVLYASDFKWWRWHKGAPDFAGLKYTLSVAAAEKWAGLTALDNTGDLGLERQPTGLRTGKNSGYQAINLAVHFGARRIVLLGFDLQMTGGRKYWHGDHPIEVLDKKADMKKCQSRLQGFRVRFESIVEPLKAAGVEVINASRQTALTCFRRVSLEEVLGGLSRAA
jgi:hypothetical protein